MTNFERSLWKGGGCAKKFMEGGWLLRREPIFMGHGETMRSLTDDL